MIAASKFQDTNVHTLMSIKLLDKLAQGYRRWLIMAERVCRATAQPNAVFNIHFFQTIGDVVQSSVSVPRASIVIIWLLLLLRLILLIGAAARKQAKKVNRLGGMPQSRIFRIESRHEIHKLYCYFRGILLH